ncbi:CBO0543 family protein [Halobacillus seohaensis]|uniref:CBO0543 family protein n=1 Tax=Halobacillus seohaensis TaxID=447421 RepID=A0ABW2EIS0_9BACI
MNTVKRWRDLNLQSLPKKPSYKKKINFKALICTLIFSSLIGTYLDLLMVGNGFYSFPDRPFPMIFSINILFTLFVLPVLTTVIIYLFKQLPTLLYRGFILICFFFFLPILEHFSELFSVFTHSNDWNHLYSGFGYVIFILIIWKFYVWLSS